MSDVRYVGRPSGVEGSIAEDAGPASRDDAEDAKRDFHNDDLLKDFILVYSSAFSAMNAEGVPASSAILP